jgi:hypothetical protein
VEFRILPHWFRAKASAEGRAGTGRYRRKKTHLYRRLPRYLRQPENQISRRNPHLNGEAEKITMNLDVYGFSCQNSVVNLRG